MSLCVLELNDAALRIGDGAGVCAESPGFATLTAQSVVVGDAARARARLDPRQTITRFWQRLGTEPLHQAPRHARHHADLAYAHLLHLHELGGKPAELLLAVPGSLTREQLAILLGIAERCPFHAVGLVDSALAASAATHFAGSALHVAMHLHQCVLTRIEREGETLLRAQVRALPGTGLADLGERWARRAASSFIQQTRFDPLHAAATEQQLYDRLPAWLAALETQDDVAVELQNGANRYQAKLRAAEMLDAVQPLYEQVLEAIARDGAGCALLLGAEFARAIRLACRLPGAQTLGADAAIRGALAHESTIRSEDRALRFVTRLGALPAAAVPEYAPVFATAPPARDLPTHLVAGSRALRLEHGVLHLFERDGEWQLSPIAQAQTTAILRPGADGWKLEPAPGRRLLLDGDALLACAPVGRGSRLSIDSGPDLLFVTEAAADRNGA